LACRQGSSALGAFFDAGVGEDSLAIASDAGHCACSRGSPFYGLIFALIADKSSVRLSQPIPGFLGAGASLSGELIR
jgi:hypothetical protein